jgi:hypothetical protein
VNERETPDGPGDVDTDRTVPTAEESWRRHLGIHDLLRQIRDAQARKRIPDGPNRSR